jgi:hypothetical protein
VTGPRPSASFLFEGESLPPLSTGHDLRKHGGHRGRAVGAQTEPSLRARRSGFDTGLEAIGEWSALDALLLDSIQRRSDCGQIVGQVLPDLHSVPPGHDGNRVAGPDLGGQQRLQRADDRPDGKPIGEERIGEDDDGSFRRCSPAGGIVRGQGLVAELGEIRNRLGLAVFEYLEVVLVEMKDAMARLVGDDAVQVHDRYFDRIADPWKGKLILGGPARLRARNGAEGEDRDKRQEQAANG